MSTTFWRRSRRFSVVAVLAVACSAGAAGPLAPQDSDPTAAARAAMVRTIREAAGFGPRPIGERALAAMAKVPRHEFVPEDLRGRAYADTPLPIGEGQTISQPYIVALMTELAGVGPGETVLEIGTGSGYQAAVLSELASKVFTIEIVAPLGRRAAQTLARLGYRNVETRIGDGYRGWREHAPFDAILVTAAAAEIPPPLVEQLAPNGTLVIPVGSSGAQDLTVLEKGADGRVAKREVLPVRFVPFTRER